MRVRDVMSSHPILARATEDGAEAVRGLMEAGGVKHVPVVDGGWLVGVWVATDEGRIEMHGRDRVYETSPAADACDAMRALLGDAELVLAWEGGVPAGVLTRWDALAILRSAMDRGIGRRRPRPAVIRVAGIGEAGTAGLLARTIGMLGHLDVAVVPRDDGAAAPSGRDAVAGAGVGDAQVVLVEGDGGAADPRRLTPDDARVAVVPAASLGDLPDETLESVHAVVATGADRLRRDELRTAVDALDARRPGLPVFPVAAGGDDRGLHSWARWIERQALRRR
ncbi:MAG: CBS domain-containing protein [Thermoleophilia bacterium]